MSSVHPTGNSWVPPIAESVSAMPLGVIERDALFQVSERRRILANPFQRGALYVVRFDKQVWILGLLRDVENFLGQLARFLVLRPHGMINRHAAEDWKDLPLVSRLLTEFPRTTKDVFHFRRGPAMGCDA